MNDTMITAFLGFVATLIPIFTVIIKVNSTLTKLNITINMLTKQMDASTKDREAIHLIINEHEKRITLLERSE